MEGTLEEVLKARRDRQLSQGVRLRRDQVPPQRSCWGLGTNSTGSVKALKASVR